MTMGPTREIISKEIYQIRVYKQSRAAYVGQETCNFLFF